MKIKFCRKYEKYVSQHHCEFFNEGKSCPYYTKPVWSTIKELLQDPQRPKWDVDEIVKPFLCSLMDRASFNRVRRSGSRNRVRADYRR